MLEYHKGRRAKRGKKRRERFQKAKRE
jgi:hypothetical protein